MPLRWPLAVGVKVMEMAHAGEAASVLPQVLLLMAKSPLMTGACNVAAVPPVFAMVMVCGGVVWLTSVAAKVSDGGVKVIAAGAVPMPVSETVAWPPATLA